MPTALQSIPTCRTIGRRKSGKRVPALACLRMVIELGVGAPDLLAFDLNEPRYTVLDAATP